MGTDGSADGMFDAAFSDRTSQLDVQPVGFHHVVVVVEEEAADVRTVPAVHGRRCRETGFHVVVVGGGFVDDVVAQGADRFQFRLDQKLANI